MNVSKGMANSKASVWLAPLGQTPDYLDPQSQEALYEVDISGMTLPSLSARPQEGEAIRELGLKELDRTGR